MAVEAVTAVPVSVPLLVSLPVSVFGLGLSLRGGGGRVVAAEGRREVWGQHRQWCWLWAVVVGCGGCGGRRELLVETAAAKATAVAAAAAACGGGG